jgi:hypothetical protein
LTALALPAASAKRRLPLFTSSSAHRVMQCAASVILPHAEDRGPHEARDIGTAAHLFLANIPALGYDGALALVPPDAPERALCEAFDPDDPATDWASAESEVAYAYDLDWDLGRRLEGVVDRAYPDLEPYEVAGTLDLLDRPGGAWRVSDWKTGVFSPSHRAQMRLLGLAVARAHGLDGVALRLVYLRAQGRPYVVEWYEDAAALDATREELRAARDRVEAARDRYRQTGEYDPQPGGHCEYCPARAHCRAPALALVATKHTPIARVREAIETPEGFAHWYRWHAQAVGAVEELGRMLRERAARAPVAMPDGTTVGIVREERRAVASPEVAREVIAHLLGAAAAADAVKTETVTVATVGSIEAAAKRAAPRGQKAATAERVLAELESRGAIETKSFERVGEVKG